MKSPSTLKCFLLEVNFGIRCELQPLWGKNALNNELGISQVQCTPVSDLVGPLINVFLEL